MKIFSKKAGRKEEADPHYMDFSFVWQNFNLLGRFEFHRQQSVVISMK
jgi:hypothetical protein